MTSEISTRSSGRTRPSTTSSGASLPKLTSSAFSFTLMLAMIWITTFTEVGSTVDKCNPVTQNLTCAWTNLCRNESIICHCDDLCEFHGDCCSDFVPKNPAKYKYTVETSCKYIDFIPEWKKTFIVDSCPETFENSLQRRQCEMPSTSQGLLSSTPVSDRHGLLFHNVFCALCNGIQNEDIIFWKAEIHCYSDNILNTTEVQQAVNDGRCFVDYQVPDMVNPPHKCNKVDQVIETCPPGFQDECTKFHCENSSFVRHVYGIKIPTEIFKNEHCAKCNLNDLITCEPLDPPGPQQERKGLFPLSIIIDFNIAGGSKVGYKELNNPVNESVHNCEVGFLYDVLMNECIFVYCAPGLTPLGDKCISPEGNITDCARRKLTSDEYQIHDNGTVIDKFGHSYNSTQYEDFGNGTIGVCVTSEVAKFVIKFDKAQTIVSIVGQCISIICLIVHLIVYSILPQLHNLPGKSLMALVASLLVAQVLFIFGVGQTDYHELCVTIGVLIHYSFLVSFFWMGIISFDIWKTFSKSSTASARGHQTNKFIKYCLLGFGGPLAIVIIALILNFISGIPQEIQPGYGEGLCWFVHRKSLIIFFAVPVFSIIFFNVLLYCLTIRALYQISEETQSVRKDSSNRRRFWLYVKLSAIMGLTWIFGLVAVLADVPALWYIFLIFNTLQGVFICVSFIFTKKVLRFLKEKFGRSWLHHSHTVSDDTRSTDLSNGHADSSSSTIMVKSLPQKQENQMAGDAKL